MDEAPDVTPDGDPIDVRTYWLPLPSGAEHPITIDFTALNAAAKRLKEAVDGLRARKDDSSDD